MTRAFTTATDSSLINLIQGARTRLALIAPALTTPVARALTARMADVFLYAFDLLELNGEDLREEPFELRKGKLERLLAHSSSGLRLVEHMEGDGPIIFRHACKLKLEGTVQAQGPRLSLRPKQTLAQDEESKGAGGNAPDRGGHLVSGTEAGAMIESAEKRGKIIRHLESAMELADELQDGETTYLIERALDAARATLFRLIQEEK